MSAGEQFLLAASGHFHVRLWAVFHVRRHSFQDHLGIRSSVVYDDVEILHSERTIHLSICHLLRNDPCL
jgi:hypothetical protein